MPGTTSNGIPARAQPRRLLAAAPEHERVAALQPHHALARARLLDHEVGDLVLRDALRAVAALAHVDALAALGHEQQDRRIDQRVVEQHLGALELAQRAHRQQVGIARTRADEQHAPAHSRPSISRRAPRASSSRPSVAPSISGAESSPSAVPSTRSRPSGDITSARRRRRTPWIDA